MSALNGLSSTLSTGVNSVQAQIKDVQTQLATGKKNLDPGQLGEVTRLSSQVTGYKAASDNISQAVNAIDVAQTGLSSINDLMTQLTDLANKASNASLSTTDLTNLNTTFQALLGQIDKITTNTEVNGVNLLKSGAANATVQAGITASDTATITEVASNTATLGIQGTTGFAATTAAAATATTPAIAAQSNALDITNATNAKMAVTALANALTSISSKQSSLAADKAGLLAKGQTDTAIATNLQASIDTIEKPDQAKLQMDLSALNNQQSIDYYLISQLNTAASAAMTIFR
jgi:flagellin-like hook-associated protein FlgL